MPNVSPDTGKESTHHLMLTDSSGTELGLICVDGRGNRVPRVAVNPYPTMASQLRQGRGKHADRVPPFEDISLDDFSGGLAMLHHDEDASKYLDGYRIDTSRAGRVLLGGKETYTTGIRDFDELVPGVSTQLKWSALYGGGTESYTATFTSSSSSIYAADKIIVWLKKTGSPTGNVTVTLADSDDGNPQAQTYAVSSVDYPYGVEFDITNKTLTNATSYKLTVGYSGGDADNYISVSAGDYGGGPTRMPHFRILDDTADFNILPFEYRGGFYCVTQPANRGNSSLYQLGTRGVADSNNGALTRLNDSSKNFSSAGYTIADGDLVKVIAGPGSEEDQPWRQASTNGSNGYITVSPAWITEHTVNTEYVVITDEWELLDALDYYCTDVVVTDRVIQLAGGGVHHRARFGNNDGTWSFEGDIGTNEKEDAINSNKLLAIRHDHYASERPVFDLYSSQLQTHSNTDLIEPNSIKKLRTPPFWGEPFYLLGTLTDNRPWIKNEFDNTDQYADKGWAAIEWDATFTTGTIAEKTIDPPVDMSEAEFILFAMKSDSAITAGHLTLTLGDGDDTWVPDMPAITTGDDMHDDFYWYSIALHADATPPTESSYPDLTKIDRVLLSVATDQNAVVKIKFGQDGLLLATRNPNNERYELGLGERVNNMIEYGGGAGQVGRKTWVGTNKNVYYIEGGQLKPIYSKEIEELEHYRNCELMEVNDVYLYFNQKDKIQSYYSGQLKNVGPDAEYGLPSGRQGIPCTGATYPGRLYVGIDAGTSGTSSVIYRKNFGWHEAYRAPLAGERIKKIHIVGRDDTTDRMYISEGADVLWIPVSLNPELDSDYEYAFDGAITTARIYGGLRETQKYYHSLTAIQESIDRSDAAALVANVIIDYRVPGASESVWTAISGVYSSVNVHNVKYISSDYDVTGRWIQFRIRFETGFSNYSPILVALVLDALERLDVNDTYSYTVGLKEGKDKLLGDNGMDTQTGVEKLTQLETWVDDAKPLTLNTCSQFEDGKLVFIEGLRKRVRYHKVDNKEQELRLVDITLIEVS